MIPEVNPWVAALSVMTATFMVALDTTVVNVSLPHIAGSLSSSVDEATWVLTSYLAANAVILPLTGWLANFFGRKRLLLFSVISFTIASLLCGLAPNLPLLVLFRVLQGASGGSMQPISQAVLLEAFPPQERGRAMGVWGLGIVAAPIFGPVMGGWLTDNYSWRWVFYINAPVGIAAVVMISLFIFDPPYIRRSSARIDYCGIALLAAGIATLQLVLDKGQEEDWFASRLISVLSVASVLSLASFVVYELRQSHPVVNLRILRNRTYSTGVVLTTLMGFALYASLVLLPVFLQTLLNYPPLAAGLATSPRGIGSAIAMPLTGILLARFDARKLLGAGLALACWTMLQFSHMNLDVGYWDLALPQFTQGLAYGLMFVPLTTATMDPIPKEAMGNATSIYNLMRNIGGSMGIAAATTMLARHEQVHTNILGAHVNLYDPGTLRFLYGLRSALAQAGADVATATQQSYAAAFGLLERQAAMLSFADVYLLLCFVFAAMIPMLVIMRRPGTARTGAHGASE